VVKNRGARLVAPNSLSTHIFSVPVLIKTAGGGSIGMCEGKARDWGEPPRCGRNVDAESGWDGRRDCYSVACLVSRLNSYRLWRDRHASWRLKGPVLLNEYIFPDWRRHTTASTLIPCSDIREA
jgi:hypothetical protein